MSFDWLSIICYSQLHDLELENIVLLKLNCGIVVSV